MVSKLMLLFCAIHVSVLTASNGQSICPIGTQRIPGSKRTRVQLGCCTGYTRDASSAILKCDPVCSPPCGVNATCSSPNHCSCSDGYELIGVACSPHCSPACVHGQCVAPNVCSCLSGYHKTSDHTCAPTCSSGCKHGACVARDMCLCNEGYVNAPDGTCVRPQDVTTRKTMSVVHYGTATSNGSQGHEFRSTYVWIPLLVIALVVTLTAVLFYTRQYLKGYHKLFILKDNSRSNSTVGVIPTDEDTPRMDFDNVTFSSING